MADSGLLRELLSWRIAIAKERGEAPDPLEIRDWLWLTVQLHGVYLPNTHINTKQSKEEDSEDNAPSSYEKRQSNSSIAVDKSKSFSSYKSNVSDENISAARLYDDSFLPDDEDVNDLLRRRHGALEIKIKEIPMLPYPLQILKALRPLFYQCQKSTGRAVLNEEKSAILSADVGLAWPVFKPLLEPGIEVRIVLDGGVSMAVWEPLASELKRILTDSYAFRRVTLQRIIPDDTYPCNISSGGIEEKTITLLLSDTAGHHWWDRSILPWLQCTSYHQPIVLIHTLPLRYWASTAIGQGELVTFRNDKPFAANTKYTYTRSQPDPWDSISTELFDSSGDLKIPHISLDRRELAAWASFVSGETRACCAGRVFKQTDAILDYNPMLKSSQSSDEADEKEAGKLLQRFERRASPEANQLLLAVASSQVLSLPVMRMLHAATSPRCFSPQPLAEVLVSGLLVKIQNNKPLDGSLQYIQFKLLPEVRRLLEPRLSPQLRRDVLATVTDLLELHWNKQSGTASFKALVMGPRDVLASEYPDVYHFANITAARLDELPGSDFRRLASKLRGSSHNVDRSDDNTYNQISGKKTKNLVPCNLPKQASDFRSFIGRSSELSQLAEFLTPEGSLVYLTGKGGVGKSQLASYFAYNSSSFYTGGIVIINTRYGLADIASQIIVFFRSAFPAVALRDDLSPLELLPMCWSQWPPGVKPADPVLLILNNQRGGEEWHAVARQLFTGMPPRFRCLVIQRELAPTNANVIDLDVMQRKDSLRLLSLQAGHEGRRRLEEEPEIAAALCEEMGDLPLALVQLGALIRIRPDLKPGQLLEDLRAKGAEARALQQAHMGLHVHGRVVETLMITWETLTEAAKELGVLLGVMAPAPIPWKLVEACRLPGQDVDEVSDFGDKQSELLRSGFLERLEQGIYQVHPFVWQYLQLQSQTQQELVIRWRKKLAMQAAKICREEIAQNLTLANIDALEQVLPHIRQVAEHYVGELRVEDLIHPFKGLAWISEQQAVYVDAIHWLRKGLAESENRLGPDHPVTAAALGNLAELLKATNSLAEAETLMRRALEIDESSYGKNHPFVAVRSNNLAALLQTTNRLAEADPLMQRALAIDEASYGPKHPKVAIRLTNLAALMQATNRLEEAEPLMRRALAIDESSYGSNHPAVARDLVNLAQLLRATKHLEEAESLIRRALAIDEASHGPSHPDVARDLTNLAQLLQVTMRLEEAELLMRRVLAIDEKNYSSNHPIVANTLNNLAQLLQITNSLEEAELLIQRALTIDVASYGTNHPVVARDLTYLAQLIQLTNRLEEAEALIRRALEIDEASYGPNHPAVASDLINLAQLMQATKRLEEAETLMRSALEIYRLTYDEHHPDINNVLAGLKTLQIKLAKQDSSTAQPPHVHDSTRQGLFICYSRKDRLFLEQFWIHFGPLEEVYDIWRWDDSRIQPGDIWLEEIEQALERTQVALLFVSPDLLASDFIRRKQLPKLFDAANKDGVKILWLPIRPCSWNRYPQIEQYQSVGSINPTLAEMSAVEMDREMVRITDRIHDLFEQIGKERLAAQEAAKAKPSALQQQEELVLAEQEAKRHADEAAQTERLSIEMARQDSGSAQPPHVHDSNREGLFICYSQKDRAFLDRFWSHLSPLAKDFGLQRWDDSRIQPGVIWLQEIEQALERAKVALLLVSPDFLAPGFILSKELPRLFEAARHGGLTILWLPIRPCLWQRHRQIEQYQAVGSLDPTLAEMSAVEMDREMVRITDRIHDLFEQIGKERLAAQEGAKAEAMAQRQEEERVLTEQEAKRQAEETARNEHLRAESEARAEAERWKAEAEAAKDEAERTRVKMEQLAREKGGLQRDLS